MSNSKLNEVQVEFLGSLSQECVDTLPVPNGAGKNSGYDRTCPMCNARVPKMPFALAYGESGNFIGRFHVRPELVEKAIAEYRKAENKND